MLCRELTLVGKASDHLKIVPLHCRTWGCEICFPRRLRDLKAIANAGEPTKFITLTASTRHYPNPNDALTRLIRSWKNIVQRVKRERKLESLEYLAVVELTKNGQPHLHILARAPYIDQQWLSDRMLEYMRSPIVDISAVRSRRHVSRYVAKYVSKGPGRIGTHKRYFKSRKWCDMAELKPQRSDSPYKWEVIDLHPSDALDAFEICGWRHRFESNDVAILECEDPSSWPSAARPPPWQTKRLH